jgi:hypothetical protein
MSPPTPVAAFGAGAHDRGELEAALACWSWHGGPRRTPAASHWCTRARAPPCVLCRPPETLSPPPRCARATDESRRGEDAAGRAHATSRRHPSRRRHLVAEAPVFIDKTPEFVDLHLRRRHVPDEGALDGDAWLPGQSQPVACRISFPVLAPTDGPQAVALNEHGYGVEEDRAWGAQCGKERALVGTESAVTGGAAQASFSVAVPFDVVRADLAAVGAKGVVTPLPFRFP